MKTEAKPAALVEGEDFYREGAFVVFTARFHLRRGYCCESGCRHCPYGDRPSIENERARAAAREGLDAPDALTDARPLD